MANVAFGYPNVVDAATLSGGSWGSTLANLQTRDYSEKARSASLSLSATKVIINHGSSTNVRVVGFAGWNLSATALLRISRGSTSGGNEVYAGSWVSAYQAPYSATLRRPPVVLIPDGYSAAYTLIEIDDGSNGAGYVEGSRLFVGDMVRPTFGAVYGRQQGGRDLSASLRLESGGLHVYRREKVRSVRMDIKALSRATEYAAFSAMLRGAGVTDEVYYLPNLTPADAQLDGFLGTFTSFAPVTDDHYGYCSAAIEIEESL